MAIATITKLTAVYYPSLHLKVTSLQIDSIVPKQLHQTYSVTAVVTQVGREIPGIVFSIHYLPRIILSQKSFFFFQIFIFQNSFMFIVKLRGRYRDFSYNSSPYAQFYPIITILHQSGTFFTSDEPTLTQHYHKTHSVHQGSFLVLSISQIWSKV